MHRRFTVGEAFETPIRGKSKYSRAYLRAHPGDHPVYSAATAGPVGSIDTYDHEGDFLSWSTNGYAGRTLVLSGRFSSTSDRALLRSRVELLDLEYCAIVLAPKFEAAARGRRQDGPVRNEYTKLPPTEVTSIEFDVPCTPTGELDIVAQRAYVERWERAHLLQERITALRRTLEQSVVLPTFDDTVSVRDVRLTDESAFVFLKRETGWFKKVWIGMDTGNVSDIPVYSAAKGPIAHVDVRTPKLINADPDHPVFSFAVDGDGSAGSNFVLHTRPFYVSNKRATVAAVDDRIDLEYVLFALQSMKADYGFNYNYKAYSGHLQDVVVPVPVGADGRYDTAAQRKQVERLSGLYTLRSRVSTLLAELTSVRVSVEGSRTSEQGRELDGR